MKDERYVMLKNFIHNELGITKDDVQEWIKETIETVVTAEFQRINQQTDFSEMLNDIALKEFNKVLGDRHMYGGESGLKKVIGRTLADRICAKLNITMEEIKPTDEEMKVEIL